MEKIAIITSEFNQPITSKLTSSAIKTWQDYYQTQELPLNYLVPGAVELPLMAQWVIDSQSVVAVVCLGAVIKGESAHFDYVCQQVSNGCQQVALSTKVPVIFGVLTVMNFEQALQRTGGKVGDSGKESMLAAIAMINNKKILVDLNRSN